MGYCKKMINLDLDLYISAILIKTIKIKCESILFRLSDVEKWDIMHYHYYYTFLFSLTSIIIVYIGVSIYGSCQKKSMKII